MALKPQASGSPLEIGAGLLRKDVYTGANTVTGKNYAIIHAWEDCVFTSIVDEMTDTGPTALNGKTLKAGDREFGDFSGFVLASGTLVCFKK